MQKLSWFTMLVIPQKLSSSPLCFLDTLLWKLDEELEQHILSQSSLGFYSFTIFLTLFCLQGTLATD